MKLTERLQEAFDKRVGGTVMLPTNDLLSAMTSLEQTQAENAALKEQNGKLESLVSRYSKGMRENLAEALKGQETIAQQAEAIRVATEKVAQLKSVIQHEIDCVDAADEEITKQAAVIEQMREAFNNCIVYDARQTLVQIAAWRVREALALQSSPEILQTRDERVAEACAQYVYAMGGTKGSVLLAEMLLSGEWRKYL